ncbi:Integrase catalytic domain-containing protein [Meloidogyne graminicola]|uniref:Integrase catalytic domain-containing protein n=1 Tax=Meloidogyne graminicola TaxID=189291 RepID=A0A8S9ZEX3_9BILA|nr:Integrase catalytic domain-containing protein [Meloidogyne graminicola]
MGSINYYGRFVNEMHKLRGPLDKFGSGAVNKKKHFKVLKKILNSELLLTHFDPSLPIVVTADASNYGVGAIISHKFSNGNEKVIERPCLSVCSAKFHKLLYGRSFILRTDHKPLLAIFGSKKGIKKCFQHPLQRWALLLANYNFKIEFVKTDKMGLADTLSRLMQDKDQQEDKVIALVQKSDCSDYVSDQTASEESLKYVLNVLIEESSLDAEVIKSETNKDSELLLIKSWPKNQQTKRSNFGRIVVKT